LLNEFAKNPAATTIVKEMAKEGLELRQNARSLQYRHQAMMACGNKIIEEFDSMNADNTAETLAKVGLLQKFIDICIAFQNEDEVFADGYYNYCRTELMPKFISYLDTIKKKRDKTDEQISYIENTLRTTDDDLIHEIDYLSNNLKQIALAKKRGFTEVVRVNEYGEAEFELKLVSENTFKVKPLSAQITVKQFVAFHLAKTDIERAMIAASAKRKDVEALKLDAVLDLINLFEDSMKTGAARHEQTFFVNKKRLGFIPDFNELSFKEHVELDTYAQAIFTKDGQNYKELPNLLAVLFRPVHHILGKYYPLREYDSHQVKT